MMQDQRTVCQAKRGDDNRIALVTTTINVPQVLLKYDKLARQSDCEVQMYVAGDVTSPDDKIVQLMGKLKCKNKYITYKQQQDRWPKLSKLIGPKKIQRRNFAYIEAWQSEAPITITIDDDNFPITPCYFDLFRERLGSTAYDKRLKSIWSDRANPFINNVQGFYKRGYSMRQRRQHYDLIDCGSYQRLKIGIIQGIAIGDPDVDAVTRMSMMPELLRLCSQQLLKMQQNWSFPLDFVPYNSQNTGFIRQLLPYQFLFPFIGRFDDIFASYFSQIVMRGTGHIVQFGKPYAIQQRNVHNFMKDLKDQLFGMQYVDGLIDMLVAQARIGNVGPDAYVSCLNKFAQVCPQFDPRNLEAAMQFLNITLA